MMFVKARILFTFPGLNPACRSAPEPKNVYKLQFSLNLYTFSERTSACRSAPEPKSVYELQFPLNLYTFSRCVAARQSTSRSESVFKLQFRPNLYTFPACIQPARSPGPQAFLNLPGRLGLRPALQPAGRSPKSQPADWHSSSSFFSLPLAQILTR